MGVCLWRSVDGSLAVNGMGVCVWRSVDGSLAMIRFGGIKESIYMDALLEMSLTCLAKGKLFIWIFLAC